MRLLFSIILIAIFSFAFSYFFPWWTVAVVCFCITVLFRLRNGSAFLAGFLGVFLLWFFVALMKDNANDHILSARMAELFHLPGSLLFLVVGALVGGVVGGLAGWSGATINKYFSRRH